VFAQDTQWQKPHPDLAALVDAPGTPWVSVGPKKQHMLIMARPSLPSISEFAVEELGLAGTKFNPSIYGSTRGAYAVGFTIRSIADGKDTEVTGLPKNPRFRTIRWSPDGTRIAFTNFSEDGSRLWIIDLSDGTARQLSDRILNAISGAAYSWLPDSSGLFVKFVPFDQGNAPVESTVPTGPLVQDTTGKKAAARTYQDLLENAHDEKLYDHYFSVQYATVAIDGQLTPIGKPAVYAGWQVSPDGKYILVTRIKRPYSYQLPSGRFPRVTEVWDFDGNVVYEVADIPLSDNIPISFNSVRTGRRGIHWRSDADATLAWVEALDGGDAGKDAEWRDKLSMLKAPFDGDAIELLRMKERYYQVEWCDGSFALVTEYWRKTRHMATWVIAPDSDDAKPYTLWDRSYEDRYNDPGDPVIVDNNRGYGVILKKGNTIFLTSTGASPEGNRPFLDSLDLESRETKRLFRSEAPYYENPVEILSDSKVLTVRESVDEPANYFVRDLASGSLTAVTDFPHPTPQLKGITKELIKYTRNDGVELSGTLYLPAGYDKEKDGPLPCILWAYPREYKSAAAASQVSGSPHRFTRVSHQSPLVFLVRGYAVLSGPAMPIVGEGESEPNDTFVNQLVSSAEAAVNKLHEMGVGDKDRMAIGGHSYGAFMTANLLAHSDLFKAGLARSGAYNRTLTPFGFQSEERTFWEAPEVYFTMSPFMNAEKIDEPLLMVHGAADPNPGTFPLQSERLFEALKGLGGTARLVMLPHEGHGYRSYEAGMHLLYETEQWLEKYVKGAE
jgi:dipeptidyl aminopeptidase/acylaminoacyl peptidase